MTTNRLQGGQALVLVLLSLAVVLTLVLFILSRSVTDIAVSSREEEAVRAFSAAEAGVEKGLTTGVGILSSDFEAGSKFSAEVSDFAEGDTNFTFPGNFTSGEAATVWFVGHDGDGNMTCAGGDCFTGASIRVCWGKRGTGESTATTPAIEASIFYAATPGDYSSVRIARVTADPYVGRISSNSFDAASLADCTIDGEDFEFQKDISFAGLSIPAGSYGVQNGLQFAKIRMLYNSDTSHRAGVDAGASLLPSQGLRVDSSGSAGESNRRLDVFQGWPEPPEIFDFAIFSSSGLSK